MGFRFHRSVKLLPGIRLNFGKRGISTSIGVRGAHVTFGSTGTRTTVGLPGTGLSYTHTQRSHRDTSAAMEPDVSEGSAWRGFLWIGLIVAALVSAIGRLMTPMLPTQAPAEIAAQPAAPTPPNERLVEVKTAALGVTQIRHMVSNSSTLSLSRVTVIPKGAICYQFHLRNSRGRDYIRTAIMEGDDLKISGSDGYIALWKDRCAVKTHGRDITAEVKVSANIDKHEVAHNVFTQSK